MDNDLNSWYFTTQIFQNDVKVHEIELPKALAPSLLIKLQNTGLDYKIYDGQTIRIDSEIVPNDLVPQEIVEKYTPAP